MDNIWTSNPVSRIFSLFHEDIRENWLWGKYFLIVLDYMWTLCRHSHYWLIEPSVSPVVAQTLISLYWTKGFNLVDIFGSNSAESDSLHSVIQGGFRHCVIQRGVRLSSQCYTRRSPTLCYTARSLTHRTVLNKAKSDTVLYSVESDSPHSVIQGGVRHCVISSMELFVYWFHTACDI